MAVAQGGRQLAKPEQDAVLREEASLGLGLLDGLRQVPAVCEFQDDDQRVGGRVKEGALVPHHIGVAQPTKHLHFAQG